MTDRPIPPAADGMPLDPQLAAIAAHAATMPPLFERPVESRHAMEAAAAAAAGTAPPIAVAGVEDMTATWQGLTVPVRLYRSATPSGWTALFFHGGGFIVGSVNHSDRIARKLCRDTGATIVSVEYRLAPEHPFPAAHDDALAAALWTLSGIEEFGGDESRFALIGESAGGNLAASTAIALRDRGAPLAAQVLIVTGVDFARDMTAMGITAHTFPMLNHTDMTDILRLYLGGDRTVAASYPPSPIRAASLCNLAPALIATAGHCPLSGEAHAYAQALAAADVPVRVITFPDMFHPFLGFFDASAGAARANDRLCTAIGEWFATQELVDRTA